MSINGRSRTQSKSKASSEALSAENIDRKNKKQNGEHDVQLREKMVSMTNLALENMGINSDEGPTWSSSLKAIIATLSFITCSGNFWFFPFLCVYYGCMFPYQFTICYFLISVPLLYMETALGQYASASPLSVFSRMVPAMAGLSAGMSFLLVFKTISLSVWSVYDFVIAMHAATGIWSNPSWKSCPPNITSCLDYRLDNCTWSIPLKDHNCDSYHASIIANRATQLKQSPFMTFMQGLMFKRSIIASDWEPPSIYCSVCALLVWILVGLISIGGSKTLGRTGIFALLLLFSTKFLLLLTGISLNDTLDAIIAFFYTRNPYENSWMLIFSWADAASHAVSALGVGCGGIHKYASMNKFTSPINKHVWIISILSYISYMTIGVYSYMFLAQMGHYYFPSLDAETRIQVYSSPLVIKSAISEVLSDLKFGSVYVFLLWLSMLCCGLQGLASYIWILTSMVIERMNGSRRKYGRPLAGWRKRVIIVAAMCTCGFFSCIPFLGNGGINLMSCIEVYASYGTLFIAFSEIVTVSYIYGFKRFSVNVRAMIGGRGPLNIYWWLNWVVISPLFLLLIFASVLATFHKRQQFFGGSGIVVELIGWSLLLVSIFFVLLYFIREDYNRRYNMEPIVVLFRATGDWGPANSENRKNAHSLERALRVRY